MINLVSENSGIYKIQNLVNNKIYIGSSINLKTRYRTHLRTLNENNHANRLLQKAWNKYGSDNFTFELIEHVDDKDKLIEKEQYYLDSLLYAQDYIKNKDNKFHLLGYNLCAIANSSLGVIRSKEYIQKITNKKLSQVHKNKISVSMTGHKKLNETKNKISKSLFGKTQNRSIKFEYNNKLYTSLLGIFKDEFIDSLSLITFYRHINNQKINFKTYEN